MARRNTTPLFEIVSRNGNGQAAPAERGGGGQAGVEPKPVVAAETGESAVRRERPAALERITAEEIEAVEAARPAAGAAGGLAGARESEAREMPRTMGRMSVSGGQVRLPVNYGYIGLSIVFVCVLLAWTIGYVLGGNSAQERARREIESVTGGAGLVDPLAGGEVGSEVGSEVGGERRGEGTGVPGGARPEVTEPRQAGVNGAATNVGGSGVGAGLPALTEQRTRYLAASGFFVSDPRTPDLNYFCLVSAFPEADSRKALEFLARNGVAAFGLEQRRGNANNPSFELYTLEGITAGEYSPASGSDRRATHEALIAELGRRWRAEERGSSDFSLPLWKRYTAP